MKTPTSNFQDQIVEHLVDMGYDEGEARHAVNLAWEEDWGRADASAASIAEAIAADTGLWPSLWA